MSALAPSMFSPEAKAVAEKLGLKMESGRILMNLPPHWRN